MLAVRKTDPAIRLDVNGIAPGLAVDRIAAALEKMGFANTLVEIGGEVRGRGRRPDGLPWHVAIEAPVAGERIVYAGIQLLDRAVSTSGDYRDTRVTTSGRRISHTIDPRTGRPIEHGLASVTVVASSAAEADAYATALSVLGSRDGYALARPPRTGRALPRSYRHARKVARDGHARLPAPAPLAVVAVRYDAWMMVDPLTTLRRRPFLAPLLFPLLALLAAGAGVYWLGTWARTTVVVLVRHAEAGTDRPAIRT